MQRSTAWSALDGVELPYIGDALQFTRAARYESRARAGEEILDGARDQDLRRAGLRENSGRNVDGHTRDVLASELDPAGVQGGTYLEAQVLDGRGELLRACKCSKRVGEQHKEAVAGELDRLTVMPRDVASDQAVVIVESSRTRY
jgi:hypothetical protein